MGYNQHKTPIIAQKNHKKAGKIKGPNPKIKPAINIFLITPSKIKAKLKQN